GDFNKHDARLHLKSDMLVNHIYKGNIKYIRDGHTQINFIFNKKDELLSFSDAQFRVNRQRASSNGNIDTKTGELDISVVGKNIRFDSDQNMINLDEKLTSFARATGNLNLLAH